MTKIFWFATGIAAGLAVAKQLRENPEAKAALEDAAKRARTLSEAFTAGYKEREAELKAPKRAASKPKSSTATAKPSAKATSAKRPAAKKPTVKPTAK